jgi:precorrin-6B methylase 1
MSTYVEAVPTGSARSAALARAYITCTEGPLTSLLGPFAEKARTAGWDVREIATGHDAQLIAPDVVAKLLLELADAA